MSIKIGQLGALIDSVEKLFGGHVYFHDYQQTFIRNIPATHHNHSHPFCITYKEINLPKCMKFEGDFCTQQSYKHTDGFWKICHANGMELYMPLINPTNKTRAGAMFIGVFQATPQTTPDMLIAPSKEHNNYNHSFLPILTKEKMQQIFHNAFLLRYFIENEILLKQNSIEGSFDRKESIIYFLNENLKKTITLNTLASFLKVSYSRAGQIIKENFNQTFPDLLLEVRMDLARNLLAGSDMIIKKISIECGFKEAEYFHKLFKNRYQITPNEYRKTHFNTHYSQKGDV